MKNQNAIMAIMTILSIAGLVGVFTVQVADAQLPSFSVGPGGLRLFTEEFFLGAGPDSENGVNFFSDEFSLTSNPVSGLSIIPRE